MSATVIGGRSAAQTREQARQVRAARAGVMIEELIDQRVALVCPEVGAPLRERVVHWQRCALVAARLAAWWRVVALASAGEVPDVFLRAALRTSYAERDQAKDARERARYWAERAAGVERSAGVPR